MALAMRRHSVHTKTAVAWAGSRVRTTDSCVSPAAASGSRWRRLAVSCCTHRTSMGVRCVAHCCQVSISPSIPLASERSSALTGESSCISCHSSSSPYHRLALGGFCADEMADTLKPRSRESVCAVYSAKGTPRMSA